jgi:hypothetical protein
MIIGRDREGVPLDDRSYRRNKARINKLFKKWVHVLGLGFWSVDVTFWREPVPGGEGGLYVQADCVARWEYRRAFVRIDVPASDSLDDVSLEKVIIHELVHALVNEMREKGIKHEESVVTGLTQAIWWTYKDGITTGKRQEGTHARKRKVTRGSEEAGRNRTKGGKGKGRKRRRIAV